MIIPTLDRIQHGGDGSRKPVIYCTVFGCEKATNGDKPYCTDHVEQNVYAKNVLSRIEKSQTS